MGAWARLDPLHWLVLRVASGMAGERTATAVWRVLAGHRGIQTVQDVCWYGLRRYYAVVDGTEGEAVRRRLRELVAWGYLDEGGRADGGRRSITVTDAGARALREAPAGAAVDAVLVTWDGLRDERAWRVLYPRLLLAVQTLSHLVRGQTAFVPVVRAIDAQAWVRALLAGCSVASCAAQLRAELEQVLDGLPPRLADMLVASFSGCGLSGATAQQLAAHAGASPVLVRAALRVAVARVQEAARREPRRFPLLHNMAEPRPCEGLSASAEATRALLLRGLDPEEVARRRGLRLATVEDHVVEIALRDPTFDIFRFLDRATHEAVWAARCRLGTVRLRAIRDALGGTVSYFAIRLALTRPPRARAGGESVAVPATQRGMSGGMGKG